MIERRAFLLGLAGSVASGGLAAAFDGGDVEISADDIAWLRRARSVWVDCESGAPALIADGMTMESYGREFDIKGSPVVARMEKMLCAVFLHAAFAPGTYRFPVALEGRDSFAVTPDHIKLLQRASWRTSAIDCKRPYGDYTNYVIDMARALGLEVNRNADGYDEIAPEVAERMGRLHREMLFVLQAYVEHSDMAPGRWFIPYDGWETPIAARCVPVTAAKIAAYKAAMATIAAGASPMEEVGIRFKANSLLFDVDPS